MITKYDCKAWFRRTMALLLALLLLVGCLPGAIPGALAAQSGTVRVKLTRLGSRSSLTLSADCAYRAGSVSIPAGTNVTVSANEDRLYMNVNGARYSMGDRMTLARKGSGTSGIRFSSPSVSNVFCGDLVLYASGSTIVPVLHIYIEDYLYGVVAYEMSNGYPLEALKSQAVAARNYAMMMAASRKSATYDVTDNTNSQVFKGYNASYVRVIQAVNETAGYMLYSDGSLAKCYYSASNGGQMDSTKNVWGTALSYSVVKDDPYDLEATAAEKRYTKIPRYPTASNPLNATLRQWLIDGIASDISKAGLTKSAVSIDEITDIAPHSPKYAAPSILYRQLKFTMKCSGKKSDGTKVSFTASCDIATYAKLETLFNLSINSGSNETIFVTKGSDDYTITFRRFGHGIGLSQHGARIMALNYGKSFKDILSFYYPGTTLKQVSLTNTIGSTSISSQVPPEATQFSVGDEVEVRLSSVGATLNLRAEPNSDSSVLATIPHGTRLQLLAVNGGWGKATYAGKTGYVQLGYVEKTGAQPEATPAPSDQTGMAVVTPSGGSAWVYAEPSTDAEKQQIAEGMTVAVVAWQGDWAKVQNADGDVGYMRRADLTMETSTTPQPTEAPTEVPEGVSATVKLSSSTSNLNVRSKPSTSSSIVTKVKHGATVQVLATEGDWAQIAVNGHTGYVMKKYLVITEQPTATPEATAEPQPTEAPTTAPEGVSATVKLSSVSSNLNVRSKPSTGSSIVTKVKHGATVQVLATEGSWAQISVNGQSGYVMKKYLVIAEQSTATPEATAEPTPTTVPEVVNAMVKLSSSTSNLNVRSKPSTSSSIVTKVKHGATVQVLATEGSWAQISVNGQTGYVMKKYLVIAEQPTATPEIPVETEAPQPTATPQPTSSALPEDTYAMVKLSAASSSLNVRSKPSTGSSIVTKVKNGATVRVLALSGDWAQISVDGQTGYVMTKYLRKAEAPQATKQPQPTPTPMKDFGSYDILFEARATANVNMREEASTSSGVIAKVPKGETVQVVDYSGEWCYALFGDHEGYVAIRYLKKQ